MWLNFVFLIVASLCVGFILGWIVARPRRWGVFAADVPGATQARPEQADVDSLAHRS
jgi:uncharacterized membrane protein AbrB (regulator of aidB expression)